LSGGGGQALGRQKNTPRDNAGPVAAASDELSLEGERSRCKNEACHVSRRISKITDSATPKYQSTGLQTETKCEEGESNYENLFWQYPEQVVAESAATTTTANATVLLREVVAGSQHAPPQKVTVPTSDQGR
jgi:hypothetical protein